MHVVVGDN